jgi:tetratricopeptide (TPR) repeat protein
MYEESIAINREVADRLPDGRVTLAGVLADYGTCLFGLGDLEAAAAATGEAIAEMRASGALRHAPVVAFYTSVLMTHVQCLMQLGEPFDEIIDEAVTFLRDIPDARLPLARALGLQAVGRNTQGAPGVIEIAGESIQLYREFDGTPDVLPAIASLLGILGQHLAFADRLPEAVAALRESGARFAAVTEILPQLVFERIDVERNLVFCVGDLGDFPEALQHATVALDLMRPLAGENPHLIPILVEMLEAQRDLFADLGHDNEAAQAAAEARQWAAPK